MLYRGTGLRGQQVKAEGMGQWPSQEAPAAREALHLKWHMVTCTVTTLVALLTLLTVPMQKPF